LSARTGLDAISSRPFHYRKRTLYCDSVSLNALAEAHGTPLYVYSAGQIRHRFSLFQEAFAARPFTICYAVKANSALGILRLLAGLGAGFDIVSGGELERVRRADKAALKRVVFSGVGKQVWEIDAALKAGILLFNVESEDELALLAARGEALGVRARFALRVNPDVFADTHPYISTGLREHKFGIDIGLARAIYRKAKRSKWLDAAGVSVHIGSQIRAVEPFAAALARVAALVGDLRKDGHDIRYVDAGGGLGIDYSDSPTEPVFDPARKVKDYAAALGKVSASLDAHLLLEPGRFLVAQAGALLSRVLFVKRNGAKTFVITDAGMNDLIRPSLYQAHHEILPVAQPRTASASVVDVVGPVCESGDFFARDRALPKVKPDDLVVLLDAGAYGMALSSNYNTRTRPAEVLVDGVEAKLIRRRETLKDLFAPEIL
jgi:diaminopimelate decarboxylase